MVVVWEQEPKAKVEQTRSEKVAFINGVNVYVVSVAMSIMRRICKYHANNKASSVHQVFVTSSSHSHLLFVDKEDQ